MPDIDLIAAIPVLNVADVPKAVAFYRDRLGFTPLFEFGPYAGVQLGSIEIHLDFFLRQRETRWTAVDYYADATPVTFAPGGESKKRSPAIAHLNGCVCGFRIESG